MRHGGHVLPMGKTWASLYSRHSSSQEVPAQSFVHSDSLGIMIAPPSTF